MTETVRGTHGGDVEAVAREYGIAVERIVDFSSNVNPMGLPLRAAERLAREARDPRLLTQYPNPQLPELRGALTRRLDVAAASIVIGAGADSLILAAVRALNPRRCVIAAPAFSEYERAARAYGCEIRTAPMAFTEPPKAGDLMVINNPHNPTGGCLTRKQMLERIDQARAAGATVLADEAFIDYAADCAITRDAAGMPNVIAIRSLTKFFGCPGLRAGYAVAAPETAAKLTAQLPAWPVTTLAANALAEALEDAAYAHATLQGNQRAREILAAGLQRLGCTVSPSAANFLFLKLPDGVQAGDLRQRLIREYAILVRECDSFAGIERGRYWRVAVRLEKENARLVEALESVMRIT